MIRNNLPYKLLAIVVTFALWFYVNAERNPRAHKPFNVPIEVRNLANDYTAELAVGDATVTIDGLKATVDSVAREHVTAWVDLKDTVPSGTAMDETVKVHTRVLDVPPEDIDVALSPRTVKVRIEELAKKLRSVEVKLLSAAPVGYMYGLPLVSPSSVWISGKTSQVRKVKKLLLPISSENPDQSIDGSFAVVPVDEKGRTVPGIALGTQRVRLKLDLIEVQASKTVLVSWSVIGSPKFPAKVSSVTVSPLKVTLKGRPNVLMGISTVGTDDVSIEGADSTVTRDVYLRVPPGVTVDGSRRVRVTVHLAENNQPPSH